MREYLREWGMVKGGQGGGEMKEGRQVGESMA